MTKEAIKLLKAWRECIVRETSGVDEMCNSGRCVDCPLNYKQGTLGEQKEALDMAIKALEQEPCDDCISRAEVMNLKTYVKGYGHIIYAFDVNKLKSVQPKPKTGHWIKCMPADEEWCYQCSECNFWRYQKKVNLSRFKYCPNCGAKMESEDKE